MPIPLVTRILVADDHALVREGVKRVVDDEPDLSVVAEATDGAEAVEQALDDTIDLAILDISMPRKTGLQAAHELSRRRPELRTLILSMYENEQFLFEALKAGASGYVLKSGEDNDIVDACRAAMRGQSFLYPSAVHTLIRDFIERAGQRPQSGRCEKRQEASGTGEVRTDAEIVVQCVPTETPPELDDEQCGDPEQHHATESPQEVRRQDPGERQQGDGPRDAH